MSRAPYSAFLVLATLAEDLLPSGARAATPPPGFEDRALVGVDAEGGAPSPVGIAFEPDGGVMFVIEKGDGTAVGQARVRRWHAATGGVSTALTIPCVDSTGERGVLGIAVDPDYDEPGGASRYVYLYYTRVAGQSGSACHIPETQAGAYNRVARYRETGGVLVEEQTLLQGPRLGANNHQGGALRFGNDGTLLIAMGDNDTDAYPVPAARDLSDLRGKILRIHRDGTIPADNPFVGQAGVRPEIWAYGLRNPFRTSVDPDTGTFYIGDVGEARWEEINAGIPGSDYGWPCLEATSTFASCDPPPTADVKPIYAYGHNGQTPPVEGDSVISGPVYRATAFPPDYHGKYFFGDYGGNWVRRARIAADGTLTEIETFLPDATAVVDLAVSPAGCLTWVSIVEGVREVCHVGGSNGQPHAVAFAAPNSGLAPLTVQFDGTASNDPDQDPLAYAWEFGDSTSSSEAAPQKTYTTNGVRQVVLTVDDGRGTANSADQAPPVRIVVGNRAPAGTIVTPPDGARYDAGDTISYSGSATDPEDGALPPSAYAWTVVFHHGGHTHPFLGPVTGATSGSFEIPTSGEDADDVFFRILLRVTDSGAPLGSPGALSHESRVDLHPNLTTLTAETVPAGAGLDLGIDQRFQPAPFVKSSVVNFPRTLTAPSLQSAAGASWEFESWSDGGAAEHTVPAPAEPTAYVASYRCLSGCDFTPQLTVTRLVGSDVRWHWDGLACAVSHDLVQGSLATLRGGGGSFGAAVERCVANDLKAVAVEESAVPTSGGSWYLVRGVGCLGAGTYDEYGVDSQSGSRDAEIATSSSSCADGDEQTPTLQLAKAAADTANLSWSGVGCASAYDAVRGDLSELRSSSGNFTAAVEACVANDLVTTSTQDATATPVGGGLWYLVRGVGCGGQGTYDEDGAFGQAASRDAEIAASPLACP
ncbi:MAG TPA: PQQ-dependent sugar dehydrogenase [Candidatus Polarisedimenticolaceae bacterium]